MTPETIFTSGCTLAAVSASSKRQLLQDMAERAVACGAVSESGLKVRDIVGAVMERERLGNTGVGDGVAIPHARIEGLDRVRAVFACLETPIDYEAVDERPVDLVVLLLAPADAGGDHLRALAQISRIFRSEQMRARLRAAPNAESLYLLLIESGRATKAA